MPYLKLVRYNNLLFMALCLLLVRFGLFKQLEAHLALTLTLYVLLVIAVICIAASGYVINNILDYDADKINNPKRLVIRKHISEKKAYNLFFALNIVGVAIGFYLANKLDKPVLTSIFILTSALLYLYATHLKHIALLGNLLISALVAFLVLLPVIFDLYPAITAKNLETQRSLFYILAYYSAFAFMVNLLREIIKDQQDINGDYKAKSNTLPLILGQKRTNIIVFLIGLCLLLCCIFVITNVLYIYTKAVVYALILIVAPLLAIILGILKAKTQNDYAKFSLILKVMLFFGILSLGFPAILIS